LCCLSLPLSITLSERERGKVRSEPACLLAGLQDRCSCIMYCTSCVKSCPILPLSVVARWLAGKQAGVRRSYFSLASRRSGSSTAGRLPACLPGLLVEVESLDRLTTYLCRREEVGVGLGRSGYSAAGRARHGPCMRCLYYR
jgi:hypothetical protein